MPDQHIELWDELTELAIENPRYDREAYLFILNGLNWSLRQLETKRHLSGEEFTEFLIAYARNEFGELATVVLEEWGIHTTRDFGEIVYKLIDIGKMSKQPDDSIEDFDNVVDLKESLQSPNFEPSALA